MHDYKQEKEGNDILDTLLRLPQKNLEKRIKQIEEEIGLRQKISNDSLSILSTHKLRLKDQLKRLHYICQSINSNGSGNDTKSAIIRLEEDILGELVNCFRDISELKEKLLQTNEELETINHKLKLLE